MATISTLDVAKDIYKQAYDALNQDNWLLAQLQKNTDSVEGLRAVHNVHFRRSSGLGAMAESGTLPTAGSQGYRRLFVPLRQLAGRIQITVATQKLLSTNAAAFVDAADAELQGNKNDLMRDVARQVWGTSDGVIATCGTTSSSTTVQLLATTTTAVKMRHVWFDGGMVVDIGTVASPTAVASARTVTAHDDTNKTITISGAAVSTTSGTHFVFRSGSGGTSDDTGTGGPGADGQKELTGLQDIVSATSTLHTLTVATESQWTAQVFGNSGTLRDPSEALINNAILKTSIATGTTPEFLVCSEEVHQAISTLLLSLRRNQDVVNLKGGYAGIRWNTPGVGNTPGLNGTAIVADMDAPANKLYGFSADSLVWYAHPDGFEWMAEDGSMFSRVANYAAYEATIVGFVELAATKRRDMLVIEDLNGVTA